jgi:hypothetical protein
MRHDKTSFEKFIATPEYRARFNEAYKDLVVEEESYHPVNKPFHYNAYKGIEVIQLTSQLDFCRGSAVKYIARAVLKNIDTEIEDLQKAIYYLNYSIRMLEDEKS